MLDAAGPMDVFAEANMLLPIGQGYELSTVGPSRAALSASNGLSVVPALGFDEASPDFDLVLVAGGPELPRQRPPQALLGWVRAAAAGAACVGSICTGAFVLAHAQLLDGRSAATHWRHVDELARQFPAISVERDRLFVRDGPLITSAGVTAGIDLSLALVAQHHGPAVAAAIAKQLLVYVQRQGGQSQFSPLLPATMSQESLVSRVQRHVLEHLAEPLSVSELARQMGMSPRNFARLFMREALISPARYVQGARVDMARQLLESGTLPLKTVAHRTGFGSVDRLRQVFLRTLGVTPSDYRERFNDVPRG